MKRVVTKKFFLSDFVVTQYSDNTVAIDEIIFLTMSAAMQYVVCCDCEA